MSILIEKQEVVRDSMGFWTHTAWPSTDDELIPYSWFTERGLEVLERDFEGDAPDELQADWFASGIANCTAWNPTTPPSEGWFIFSIHDTEDGPICVWVRHIQSGA